MAKVKLYNRNLFDIGIKLINPVREQNIKAGSFTIVDEDDVYYLDTVCTLIKRGMLIVDAEKTKVQEINTNLGFVEQNPNIKSDQELETIIKGNYLKMKKELSYISEPHIIDAVYRVAVKLASELNGGKLKYLSDYCGRPIIIDDITG
jgi:hypothetical protein